MKQAFISYRRQDSANATRALAEQLRGVFGAGRIFMDRNRIIAGSKWPERLQSALDEATLLLAVIGPQWLRVSDSYGRRRLDKRNDWVRLELERAFRRKIPIIPILLDGAKLPFDEKALPKSLRPLVGLQHQALHDEAWDQQLRGLVELMADRHGFVLRQKPIWRPVHRTDVSELDPKELERRLTTLPGWEPIESMIPGDYPKSRIELHKVFVFDTFPDAVRFMSEAVDFIEDENPYPHYPRWENLWKSVSVWLSTWGIGHRISHLDIKLARELDRVNARLTE